MDDAATLRVLSDIIGERSRQVAQFGEQHWPDGTAPGLGAWGRYGAWEDQANEARSATQRAAAKDSLTWRHILTEEVYEAFAENDPAKLRAELIQVAAVAVAWIEAIDRRTPKGS